MYVHGAQRSLTAAKDDIKTRIRKGFDRRAARAQPWQTVQVPAYRAAVQLRTMQDANLTVLYGTAATTAHTALIPAATTWLLCTPHETMVVCTVGCHEWGK